MKKAMFADTRLPAQNQEEPFKELASIAGVRQ
jgi:hypothetical protein